MLPQVVQQRYQRGDLELKLLDAFHVVGEEQPEIEVNVLVHRMVAIQEPALAELAAVNVVVDKPGAGMM